MNASSIDEVKQDLEKVLVLMREARFTELADHAEQMNRHVVPVEQLKAGIEAARNTADSAEVGPACERLKKRLHLVSEVLRHGAMVEYGLREIELAFTTSYSENGYPKSSKSSRLSAEA